MAYTYDLATQTGRMRLLIPDRVTPDHIFEDEELQVFLTMEGGVLDGAAAALESIASDQAMTLKVMRLLDIQTDGARVSEALLARAAKLRAQAEAQADGFDWAEMVTTDFAARERLIAETLRSP